MIKILRTLQSLESMIILMFDLWQRDHCHITGKYRCSARRDCNINIELSQKGVIVFQNQKKYDAHLIMQKPGKFNIKINVTPNGLENHMSFSINNKLRFIDSFQFLSSLLDSLVKTFGKNYFKYLSQEFDNNILDLVKQEGFSPYGYMSNFKKFKEHLPSKENFLVSWPVKNKDKDKEYEHVLKVWNTF